MAELDAAEWWVLAARSPFKTPRSHAGENPATATNNIAGGGKPIIPDLLPGYNRAGRNKRREGGMETSSGMP